MTILSPVLPADVNYACEEIDSHLNGWQNSGHCVFEYDEKVIVISGIDTFWGNSIKRGLIEVYEPYDLGYDSDDDPLMGIHRSTDITLRDKIFQLSQLLSNFELRDNELVINAKNSVTGYFSEYCASCREDMINQLSYLDGTQIYNVGRCGGYLQFDEFKAIVNDYTGLTEILYDVIAQTPDGRIDDLIKDLKIIVESVDRFKYYQPEFCLSFENCTTADMMPSEQGLVSCDAPSLAAHDDYDALPIVKDAISEALRDHEWESTLEHEMARAVANSGNDEYDDLAGHFVSAIKDIEEDPDCSLEGVNLYFSAGLWFKE